MENIEFENGKYGLKAIIRGEWEESFLRILLEKRILELELNDGKGWFGNSIEFLTKLPQLKSLIILRLPLKSIEPIHHLTGLVNLELTTYSETPVDFGVFRQLEDCWFEWISGSESLFQCNSLRRLGLNSYAKKNGELFSKLTNLEQLSVLNSKIENLDGISKLTDLTCLRLANLRNVTSLNGIQNLTNLAELEIQRCKGIYSVSEIFQLVELKRLLLLDLGNIETIHGIENLSELREFLFYESTSVDDGDLSPILKLKNLSSISFRNRSHYTHRREDFGSLSSLSP